MRRWASVIALAGTKVRVSSSNPSNLQHGVRLQHQQASTPNLWFNVALPKRLTWISMAVARKVEFKETVLGVGDAWRFDADSRFPYAPPGWANYTAAQKLHENLSWNLEPVSAQALSRKKKTNSKLYSNNPMVWVPCTQCAHGKVRRQTFSNNKCQKHNWQ